MHPRTAQLETKITKKIKLKIPIIAAAMDTVAETEMAVSLGKLGGLAALHRNCTIEEEVKMVKKVKKERLICAAACGPHDLKRAKALDKNGVDIIFVDCAHAHNLEVVKNSKIIKKPYVMFLI